VAWNTVILYPRGIDKRTLMVEPSVVLPQNWVHASSLPVTGHANGRVSFAPVFGHGLWAFKRNGHWLYCDSRTKHRFRRHKFIEATDAELMLELEKREFSVFCPAHEGVDRPNLPCPACEKDSLWGF
jgi:hypothetical protein